MDVEKTIEFILAQEARAEGQMAAIRAQQAKAEGQMAAIRAQQVKAESQMAAIRKLIQAGMRMIVKQNDSIKEVRESLKEVKEDLRELAKAQKVTEIKLQTFIDSLRRGGNGGRSKN